MAMNIRNDHLEQRIAAERDRRGHATLSGTAEELLIERLTQIESAAPSAAASAATRAKSPEKNDE